MRLRPRIVWTLEPAGRPLDPRVLVLLRGIAARGSLATACEQAGLSYRTAWGILQATERAFGLPLVFATRGRGAELAPAGTALLKAHEQAEAQHGATLARSELDLGGVRPPAGTPRTRALRLHMIASHDLALAALRDRLARDHALELDLEFRGSLESLAALDRGDADLAGFHVAIGDAVNEDRSPFLRWLKPRRDRLITFLDRDQGLIVARGNPKRLRSLADVATKRVRFVNRQRGSGTRLLVDALLKQSGVAADAVEGYGNEEFTHLAVAATVAAGNADAGFGVRAAAARFGLGFVSLTRERYFFAARAASLNSAAVTRLIDALRAGAVDGVARELPGYRATAPGTVLEPRALETA